MSAVGALAFSVVSLRYFCLISGITGAGKAISTLYATMTSIWTIQGTRQALGESPFSELVSNKDYPEFAS